jgi:AcrR family transcriptional regulator
LPSVNQIIKEAGVAKGTVYLYFESKEEIYLSLLSKYFAEFEESTMKLIDKASKDDFQQALIDAYLAFAKTTPKGVYLACIAPLILENNLSDEFIAHFKINIRNLTFRILEKVASITHEADLNELRIKFLLSYNLFLGTWQHCHPPMNVLSVLMDQGLDSILYDFEKEFARGHRAIWKN